MNVHKNARLTPRGRAILVHRIEHEGWPVSRAAEAAGVSRRTAWRWRSRYRRDGEAGLQDRSSRPHSCPHALPGHVIAHIERLRRQRLTGQAISKALGLARSTIGAVLRRIGLGKLSALEPKAPVIRYERAAPGELIHLDIKKLGRFARPGIASLDSAKAAAMTALAGTSCMSASMTPPDWPTPRSCPARTSTTPAPS